MRLYIDIINESDFLTESYRSLNGFDQIIYEDFRDLYAKGRQVAANILAKAGDAWQGAATRLLGKSMDAKAANSFVERASNIASRTVGTAKMAAAVIALCAVVNLSHANAATMDDQSLTSMLQQVTPDAVNAQTPDASPEPALRTPDAVNARSPDAVNPKLRTPDNVTMRTPSAAPQPILRTPDAVNARKLDAAPNPKLRTPDKVTARPLGDANPY